MRIKFKFKRKKCPLQVVPSMSQTATSSESSCHCCNCCCDLISSTNSCCCDCCCCCRTAGPFPGPCLGDGRNSLDIYDSITDLFSYPGATMGSGGGGSCSVFKHWTSQRHQSHPHQQHYHCNYNHHHCSNHCKCNQYYNTKQTAAVKPKLECHLTKKPDGNKLCPEVASDKQQQHTSLPNLPSGNCAKGSACQPLPSRPKHRPPRRSTSMISINRISSSRLLLGSLLILQIVSASAMLDALKALFILTGASTYLVTKYVNITNNNRTDVAFLADYNQSLHNPGWNSGLNFFKDGPKPAAGNTMRPLYVLAVEEEEDERTMPKLLLKLSISSSALDAGNHSRPLVSSSITQLKNGTTPRIEYILDAKMDDLSEVYKNFVVNKTTGELFLLRPLDRDPPNGRATWRFTVQARNSDTLLILALADVLVTVRDINDNKPLFEQKVYKTSLMENGPAGQILTKLTAVDFDDVDTTDNGKVVYSLVKSAHYSPASVTDHFQVDPHTGVLTVLACCFDREKRSEYRLVARATDAGGLSDEATIVVSIGDVNDCPPKFLNPTNTLVFDDDRKQPLGPEITKPEEAVVDGEENIYTFYVSDDDLPESNHHTYEIANSTENCTLFERFHIVTNGDGSGTLFGVRSDQWLENQLQWNQTYSCQLQVVVRDVVRDNEESSGQVWEDFTTLAIVYRNSSRPAALASGQNTSNANAVVALDESMVENTGSSHNSHLPTFFRDGPKAYDLTGKRVILSECSLCQNGGQCIVTETGYRFRCYCQPGFDGALCERALTTGHSIGGLNKMLHTITANELLLYGSLIVVVNLFVIVLAVMVWLFKRVRHTVSSSESLPPLTSAGNTEIEPQLLSPPMLEPTHFTTSYLLPMDSDLLGISCDLTATTTATVEADEKLQLQMQPYVC